LGKLTPESLVGSSVLIHNARAYRISANVRFGYCRRREISAIPFTRII